ncbi:MAG: HEAT repeat domain-containing protein, partial [Deltaproteobacteria bacterium]|nr:HEAT repeat domain-containing protein [Deltaproteobacteria bacterium]
LAEQDIPALCALLTRRHPATRANVIVALASLQAPACPDGSDPARLLASAQAPQVRAAAARWLQATGRPDAAATLARHARSEVDPRVIRACRAPELPPLGRQSDVYAYGADAHTPLEGRLMALTLADSSVLVAPTDALAHLHLDHAPEGELSLWDPAIAPLEP